MGGRPIDGLNLHVESCVRDSRYNFHPKRLNRTRRSTGYSRLHTKVISTNGSFGIIHSFSSTVLKARLIVLWIRRKRYVNVINKYPPFTPMFLLFEVNGLCLVYYIEIKIFDT